MKIMFSPGVTKLPAVVFGLVLFLFLFMVFVCFFLFCFVLCSFASLVNSGLEGFNKQHIIGCIDPLKHSSTSNTRFPLYLHAQHTVNDSVGGL